MPSVIERNSIQAEEWNYREIFALAGCFRAGSRLRCIPKAHLPMLRKWLATTMHGSPRLQAWTDPTTLHSDELPRQQYTTNDWFIGLILLWLRSLSMYGALNCWPSGINKRPLEV